MKNIVLIIILTVASLSNGLAQQKLNVDIEKSTINWTGHAEIGSYAPTGTINIKSGTVKLKKGEVVAAEIFIDMNTLKHENEDMTSHLKSEQFFDVKKFPLSVINIARIVNRKANGTLTIKNKTGSISVPVEIAKTSFGLTISGKTTIDRTKYGVIYNSTSFFSGLGDNAIRNKFDIDFKIMLEK